MSRSSRSRLACVLLVVLSLARHVSAQGALQSGEEVYRAACAACHGDDGTGAPRTTVGFDTALPDFTDCAFTTSEADYGQSCHMPAIDSAPMASVLGELRDRLGRHTFLGGNFLMLRILNRYRTELAVESLPQELDAAANATIRQLQTETATVSVATADRRDGLLDIAVVVRNLTGHKLPTGYPSRRAWVHVTVRDQEGSLRFQSGNVTASGAIRGNDNDEDPLRFEPHYAEIRREDQVQVYESILGDVRRTVTTGLLYATQYLKDNRLLPRGFDKGTAVQDIAVIGDAATDNDFSGDGDRVRYLVDVAGASPPFTIDVALRFQPIAFRWADNLRPYAAAEPRRFVRYFDAMAASSSIALARDSLIVP